MIGVIYKYTSPSGKVYIGQTINEKKRRSGFLCETNDSYSKKNSKIDNARKKYGVKNFKYDILFKKEYSDINEMIDELNFLERKYIIEYDSLNNGYNMTEGGEGVLKLEMSEETKNKITKANLKKYEKYINDTKIYPIRHKNIKKTEKEKNLNRCGEKNSFYGKHHSEETKKIISEKNSVKVVQIDKDTNEIINVFKSAKEAGNYFGKPRGNAEILKVCRGRFKIQNGHIKHNRTAYGFRWKYLKDIEGSTTIEEDGKIYYRP